MGSEEVGSAEDGTGCEPNCEVNKKKKTILALIINRDIYKKKDLR